LKLSAIARKVSTRFYKVVRISGRLFLWGDGDVKKEGYGC